MIEEINKQFIDYMNQLTLQEKHLKDIVRFDSTEMDDLIALIDDIKKKDFVTEVNHKVFFE